MTALTQGSHSAILDSLCKECRGAPGAWVGECRSDCTTCSPQARITAACTAMSRVMVWVWMEARAVYLALSKDGVESPLDDYLPASFLNHYRERVLIVALLDGRLRLEWGKP